MVPPLSKEQVGLIASCLRNQPSRVRISTTSRVIRRQRRYEARTPLPCHFSETDLERIRLAVTSGTRHNAANNGGISPGSSSPVPDMTTTFEQESLLVDYEVVRQARREPTHGRGGCRRGAPLAERRKLVAPQITQVLGRAVIAACGGRVKDFVEQIHSVFQRLYPNQVLPPISKTLLATNISDSVKGKDKAMYDVLPAPYLGVCIKIPYSQVGGKGLGAKDRYAVCTWLTPGSQPWCTCVGNTRFRIGLNAGMHSACGSMIQRTDEICSHVEGVIAFVEVIAASLRVDKTKASAAICDLYARRYSLPLAQYFHTIPEVNALHKESVAVISDIAPGTTDTIQFIPVRVMQDGSRRYICAFCDTTLGKVCYHIRLIRSLEQELDPEGDEDDSSSEGESAQPLHNGNAVSPIPNYQVWSHHAVLPLSPVNCSRALRVDQDIAACALRRESYLLSAPSSCHRCGHARNPKTRRVSEGVIMCTLGPCLFHYETFRCSNENCRTVLEAEGREHCVVIEKSSAATHALLRRELIGVVMSNGTLSGRLKLFHSQVTSLIHANILPPFPECRSVKTIQGLCNIMLKLMTTEPEPSLFTCSNCDNPGMSSTSIAPRRRISLCVDGINQGYRRSKQAILHNSHQHCQSVSASSAASNENSCRPLNSLLRRDGTASMILKAIRGDTFSVDDKNVPDCAAAIRIVSKSRLPAQFCSQSICGRTWNDYYSDMGSSSVLHAVSRITNSLFHSDTPLLRLLNPLEIYISKCVSENRISFPRSIGAVPRIRPDLRRYIRGCHPPFRRRTGRFVLRDVRRCLDRLRGEPYSSLVLNGVWWSPELQESSTSVTERGSREDALKEILNLYVMMVQGPITQFIRRHDVRSLEILGTLCSEPSNSNLIEALKNPSSLQLSSPHTNLLQSCRILRASLFDIVEFEENRNSFTGRGIRASIGSLLSASAFSVKSFYTFFDNGDSHHSYVKYAADWSIPDADVLRSKFEERFSSENNAMEDNQLRKACRTGFYFPSLPQIRPLPFNADDGSPYQDLGPCTKNYTQNQKRYTPGAVTVSCDCATTVTYGIKVLSKDEGTKSILDVGISRFPSLPEFFIYDFACGLYQSAVNSLWWEIDNTRIVSDKFHSKNHTCSPCFNPDVYTELDHRNTVSHEQRNRGIAELCKSLRNGGQDYHIALLAYHTMIMNIRSKAKSTKEYQERDRLLCDYDVEWCYFECLRLSCSCCSPLTSS